MRDARPAPDAPPGVGAALRAAREAAGLSVEDVSAATRIRATLVRDLEDDRFGSSGGPVYARGHVRSIAGVVGLDAAQAQRLFDTTAARLAPPAEDAAPALPVGPVGGPGFALPTPLEPERRGPRWGVAGAVAASVVVGLYVVGSVSGPSTAPTSTLAALPADAASPVPTRAVPKPPAPDAVAERPPVTGAQLRVRTAGGASWISITGASGTLFEGVLRAGEFKDFQDAESLKLVIGNAGAVNLVCGTASAQPAGARGRVVRFTCTPAGLSRS